jgi:hypothetical protein
MTGVYYFEKYLNGAEQFYFKEEVINQTTSDYLWQYLDKNFESFEEFLKCAFVWEKSKQGFHYWDLIERRADFELDAVKLIKGFISEEFYDYPQYRIDELEASIESYVRNNVSPIPNRK